MSPCLGIGLYAYGRCKRDQKGMFFRKQHGSYGSFCWEGGLSFCLFEGKRHSRSFQDRKSWSINQFFLAIFASSYIICAREVLAVSVTQKMRPLPAVWAYLIILRHLEFGWARKSEPKMCVVCKGRENWENCVQNSMYQILVSRNTANISSVLCWSACRWYNRRKHR